MIDKVKLAVAALLIVAGLFAYYFFSDWLQIARVGVVLVSVAAAGGLVLTTEAGRAAWKFATEARGEVRKVVWPTRREAAQVTLVVIVMVIIVGLYMWLLDAISFYAIYDLLLGVRES